MTSPDEELERLRRCEDALEALQSELTDLESQHLNDNGCLDPTMRGQRRCPSCGARRIIHASEVLDRADGPSRQKMSLVQPTWRGFKGVGTFEAWICTSCGLVEWRIPNLTEVPIDGKLLRLVELAREGEGGEGPELEERETARESATFEKIDGVRASLHRLERAIRKLRGQADAAAGAVPDALPSGRQCPACGNLEAIHATSVLDRSEVGRDKMALKQPRILTLTGVGEFEAWTCRRCGLVQWRIPNLEGVEPDGKTIRLIDGDSRSPANPYR